MTMKNLSLTALLFLATACSLPGGNDLNSPDETLNDIKNYEYNKKKCDTLKTEQYTLELVTQGQSSTTEPRCVYIEFGCEDISQGTDNKGQAKSNIVFTAKYTDYDAFLVEEKLEGTYLPEVDGRINYLLPAASSATTNKTLQINGLLINKNLTADITIEGFTTLNLRGKLAPNSNCLSKSDNYQSKMEKLFAGDWEATVQKYHADPVKRIDPRVVQFTINFDQEAESGVIKIKTRGVFENGYLASIPVEFNLVLSQLNAPVTFKPIPIPNKPTIYPKFNGKLVDYNVIKGKLDYGTIDFDVTFKRKK